MIESIYPKPTNDVSVLRERQEVLDLGDVELKVRIGEEQQLVARIGESGLQRFGVAAIWIVVKGSNVHGIRSRESICNLAGSVSRTVVDDEHFPFAKFERSKRFSHSRGCGFDVLFFVV